jgi:hypothetical protein
MFEKIKKRWKVSGWQFFLIICVFAITGTLTAYISRYITGWLGFTAESALWKRALLRGSILLFGYQVIILLVSIPFGQFKFFWNYEKKILRRMRIMK